MAAAAFSDTLQWPTDNPAWRKAAASRAGSAATHPSAIRPELRARSRLGRSHGFHCLAIISSTQVFAAFLSLASAHSPSCQYINSPHSPAAPLGWAATIPVAAAMASTRTASSFNLEGMLCSPLSLVKGGGEKASECYSFVIRRGLHAGFKDFDRPSSRRARQTASNVWRDQPSTRCSSTLAVTGRGLRSNRTVVAPWQQVVGAAFRDGRQRRPVDRRGHRQKGQEIATTKHRQTPPALETGGNEQGSTSYQPIGCSGVPGPPYK